MLIFNPVMAESNADTMFDDGLLGATAKLMELQGNKSLYSLLPSHRIPQNLMLFDIQLGFGPNSLHFSKKDNISICNVGVPLEFTQSQKDQLVSIVKTTVSSVGEPIYWLSEYTTEPAYKNVLELLVQAIEELQIITIDELKEKLRTTQKDQ